MSELVTSIPGFLFGIAIGICLVLRIGIKCEHCGASPGEPVQEPAKEKP